MKRISAIISLVLMLTMMMIPAAVFADGETAQDAGTFAISETIPENGAKNTTKENLCVKVYFDSAVGNAESKAANNGKVVIKDADGTEYPTLVYYNSDEPNYMLVMVDTTQLSSELAVKDDTEYSCTIPADFVNNEGAVLGADQTITFRTMNQNRNNTVYMIMMFVMFGGMFIFTGLQTKKKAAEAKEKKMADEAFNPYKEAKRTGKSLAEVIEEHEKEEQKKHSSKKDADKIEEKKPAHPVYKVKAPRPIAAAGSTYASGRKAAEEAKKQQEELEKQERKANNYQKKQRQPKQGQPVKHHKKKR